MSKKLYSTNLLTLVFIAFLLSGCNTVTSTHPVGQTPLEIKPEEWEQTWVHTDGAITLEVLDGEKGLLRVAWIEEEQLKSGDIYLHSSGDWFFASFKEDQAYLWFRIVKEENQILFWIPSFEKFKSLVEEGVLPGEIKNSNVLLGELGPQHLDIIKSEEHGVLFHWDEPLVFSRVGR